MIPSHWSARYLLDRARLFAYQWSHRDEPWITPDAVALLHSILSQDACVFEWGSGRSTLWTARRVKSMISVEHDGDWFKKVQAQSANANLTNVAVWLRPDESGYVSAIDGFQDETFDLVVVDGVSNWRADCSNRAIPKLKPAGYLMVDDVHRYLPSSSRAPLAIGPHEDPATLAWAEFSGRVENWDRTWTSSGVTDTAFWRKPVCEV